MSCTLQEFSGWAGDKPLERDPGERDLSRLRRKATMELSEVSVAAGSAPANISSATEKAPRMANYQWLLGFNSGSTKVLSDGLVRRFVEKPVLRLQANQTRQLVNMWCPEEEIARPRSFLKTR